MKNMTINGPIIQKVYKNCKISENQKNSNIENALKIFNKIPNGFNSLTNNVGLVVGKVQSGKTANIIALTALSFDNNHRLCIMLLSDTNNLLDQNASRIQKSFDDIDDVIVFKKSSTGDFNDIDEKELQYLYNQGKKVIICSLKHYKHISMLKDVIEKTSFAKDYSIIVDDESDDISQNTSPNKFEFNDNNMLTEMDRSRTNESIYNLKQSLLKNSYISVTATPQANILLQKFQALAPNFCVTIQPGKGYTGLNSFHSQNSGKIFVIDDFSKDDLEKEHLKFIPKSLYNALVFFLAGCIARKKRETKPFKHSFLIHPSKKIVEHQKLYDAVQALINNFQYGVKHNNNTGKDLLTDVLSEYKAITNLDDCSIKDLDDCFSSLKLHCINGQNDINDLEQRMKILPYHIIVGGDMLDRGITINGLAVSYMTRESKIGQVDTLLQRARWFGYKQDYFDTCRVYLTKSLKLQFEEIIEHEDSIWDFLTYCSELTYDIRNEQVELVINSSVLRPTSQSKVEVSYGKLNSVESQKYFTINKQYNDNNIQLVRQIEDRQGLLKKFNKIQTHKLINISFAELKQFLLKFKFQDNSLTNKSDFNAKTIIDICNKLNIPEDESIDVLRMRVNNNEERTTVEDYTCKILNLMQGRSEGKTDKDIDYYVGDRYLVNDNIMLQIHHVILKNNVSNYYQKGDEIIMICLLFPKKYALKGMVTRKQISEIERKYC